jgi:hypothetical protein
MILNCIPPSEDLARALMDSRRRATVWMAEPVRLNRQFGRRSTQLRQRKS